MADGIAPAIQKVSLPPPGAREAQAPIPSLNNGAPTAQPTSAPGLTASAGPQATSAPQSNHESNGPVAPQAEEKKLEAAGGGAGPALGPPKPVEVMSVPETPVNGSTPVGGTPRPELNIPVEKMEVSNETSESVDTTGILEPTATPVVSASKDTSPPDPVRDDPKAAGLNGASTQNAEMTGAIQAHDTENSSKPKEAPNLKRKAEDEVPITTAESSTTNGGSINAGQPEKKAKLDEAAPSQASNSASTEIKSTETAGDDKEKTNGGRAKKGFGKRAKKIAEQVVGKTARKTRSQGPAA